MNPGAAKSTFTITTPSDREIAMTRVFNAPRRLVFDALSKPELVKQWLLGPPGWSMPVCDINLKVGGTYRYVWKRDSDGTEMSSGGVFREIIAPDRIVATEKFEQPWYPGESMVTSTLVAHDSKTTLTMTVLYDSRETRDMVLKSGMETGVAASYDRLAELLASLHRPGETT
ncbi:MAG TPA: SRPBCC family protein [Candidatus Acidoferrum sp.]|nr:SRPBCC family protein [Candidatus Acidoferrum sp.]